MIRKDFFLTNNQYRTLRKLEGNVSEHIRRAIDKYITEIKKTNVSISPTKEVK